MDTAATMTLGGKHVKKRDIIAQAALDRIGCGYIYGGTGAYCKVSYRQARAEQYPEYAAKMKANCQIMSGKKPFCDGCPWYEEATKRGKQLYDCAQLMRVCAKLAGYTLVSGAHSQWTKTAWVAKGTMDYCPANRRGLAFFWMGKDGRMKHVAPGIDGTIFVEARGHDYGVVKSTYAARKPTHWAQLPKLEDDSMDTVTTPTLPQEPVTSTMPMLRQGSTNKDYVTSMQNLLIAKGCTVEGFGEKDRGIFGPKTLIMLKTFQGLNGLEVDGICGPMTWAALLEDGPEDEPDEKPEIVLCSVNLVNVPEAEADALVAQYPGSTKAAG